MSGRVGGRDTKKKCLEELERLQSISVSNDGGEKAISTDPLFFLFLKASGGMHCPLPPFPNVVFCLRVELKKECMKGARSGEVLCLGVCRRGEGRGE